MEKHFILLLDGMMGSGKTTTTKLLAKELPRTAIIGMDKIKRFVSDFKRCTEDNTIDRNVTLKMAKEYIKHDISIIIDQAFKTDEIKKYEALANKHNLAFYKFQLFTSPEIANSRIINRQKDFKDKVPKERIEKNISLFKKKDSLGFTLIDTSNLKEKAVSNLILKKIKAVNL